MILRAVWYRMLDAKDSVDCEVSMGEYEAKLIIKKLAEFQKKATSSREAARRTLQDAGIITKSGKLAKKYTSSDSSK